MGTLRITFEERAVEKILLKKRWELMGQWVEKGKIKIRGKTGIYMHVYTRAIQLSDGNDQIMIPKQQAIQV